MMPVIRGPPGGHSLMPPEPLYGQTAVMDTKRKPQPAGNHIPLAKCRVLYLGSAVPLETANGIEALQQPLRERFPFNTSSRDIPGIDVRLTAYSSGLQMHYVDDQNSVVWFPIQSLHVCAAVKAMSSGTGPSERVRFLPLDSPEAENSRHPPMFACIMRRTKGVKVLECHMFIAKSKAAAMALVQSCTHAYEHKELWREDAPPIEPYANSETHLVPADAAPAAPDASPEFFEQPPPQGYYYSSSKDLVRNYNVHGGKRGMPPPSVQGRPLPPRPPPAMMPPPGMMMYPPTMLPPPPAGYFADWDMNSYGPPIAVFPGGPYAADEYEAYRRRRQRRRSPNKNRHRKRSRKPMSPGRARHFSPGPRMVSPGPRMVSPGPRMVSPPPPRDRYQRHLSPSPPRHGRRAYSDGYSYSTSGSSASSDRHDVYYKGRSHTPPADYGEYYARNKSGRNGFPHAYNRKEPSDLVLYAPRYMRDLPSRGRNERHYSPGRHYSREERRAGDVDNYYNDAYRDDDTQLDADMLRRGDRGPRSYDDLAHTLGYWP